MPALVFNQVTIQANQSPELCVTNMGDGSVRGLIGLLDATNTSHAFSEMSFSFTGHQGDCLLLPAVRPTSALSTDQVHLIGFVSVMGGADVATTAFRSLIASLQIRDGNTTRFVMTPSFMPTLGVPAAN